MTLTLVDPPTDFTSFEMLEWLEQTMVLTGVDRMSRAAILARFPAGQSPDQAELDQTFTEVRRRSDLAPSVYPFRYSDDEIILDTDLNPTIYVFLLVLSIQAAPFRKENRYNDVNPAFELLTREALIAYGGPGTQAARFGWPSGDDRPENLGDAVEWLAERMGLSPGVVRDEVDRDDKDGGVDVVAWKPFADGSPSFLVWLAQCTVQETFERKAADVQPLKWLAWIGFGRPPGTVLSVPYAIPNDAKVRGKLKYDVDVVLDRLRICEQLHKGAVDLASFPEHAHMTTWARDELLKTARALSAPSEGRTPRRAKRRASIRPPRDAEPLAS